VAPALDASYGSGRHVRLAFDFEEDRIISLLLDEHGEEIREVRRQSDNYKRDTTLPDWNVFYLGGLPPVTSDTE
jgi:hypothetical protein